MAILTVYTELLDNTLSGARIDIENIPTLFFVNFILD